VIGRDTLFELLLALLMLAAAAFGGKHYADKVWEAKDAKRLQEERIAADSERLRAEKASGAFQAELLAQRIANDQLEGAFNAYKRARRPVLTRVAVGPSSPASAPHTDTACTAAPDVSAGVDFHLTRGAVWMWNSSLLQRDTPAGACGLADSSEESCAIDAGVGVDEALDNQSVNARICAEDRLRHQRLIDFIKGRKQ
jgi:hypothetical protein